MLQNGDDLAAFYKNPLGQWARHVLARRIRAAWPNIKGLRLLAYGYGTPYMRGLEAERAIAAMPAQFGAPTKTASRHARLVCAEDALPFSDVFFDRILIVHGLETADSLRPLLRQHLRREKLGCLLSDETLLVDGEEMISAPAVGACRVRCGVGKSVMVVGAFASVGEKGGEGFCQPERADRSAHGQVAVGHFRAGFMEGHTAVYRQPGTAL